MNISAQELLRQYQRARERCGDLVDRIESEFGFPRFILYAIGSRETNWDPHWETHPGDKGNGHGYLQIDKGAHPIPADWTTNLEWQIRTGAEVLDFFHGRFGSWEAACNGYNSGQSTAEGTTGHDYGPDVMARRAWLDEHADELRPEEREALLFTRSFLEELKSGGWFVGEVRDRLARLETRVDALQAQG